LEKAVSKTESPVTGNAVIAGVKCTDLAVSQLLFSVAFRQLQGYRQYGQSKWSKCSMLHIWVAAWITINPDPNHKSVGASSRSSLHMHKEDFGRLHTFSSTGPMKHCNGLIRPQ